MTEKLTSELADVVLLPENSHRIVLARPTTKFAPVMPSRLTWEPPPLAPRELSILVDDDPVPVLNRPRVGQCQDNLAFFVSWQVRTPIRIFDVVNVSVGVPVRIAWLAIDFAHQFVRTGIVWRNRRMVS